MQAKDKPLYEGLLWSRPENKAHAGKLLIVGGNSNGFRAPATAYSLAIKAGVGVINVLLPESLKSSVGPSIENTVFCPANKSGGLSRQALAKFLDYASNSDLTLLAGDFGHNSETAILLESFIEDYRGPVCLTNDGLDPFYLNPNKLFERPETLLVAETSKLQKLLIRNRSTRALSTSLNLIQMVELLGELTKTNELSIVTRHQNRYVAAVNGRVSTTETKEHRDWQYLLASYSSVWWLQSKGQKFKAITTAIYDAAATN